jgi:hypothetical protein
MVQLLPSKLKMAGRVIPFLVLVGLLKYLAHILGLEVLEINAILTALISANIFLIGFNISGVLADFKAGEKLPGELAASIEAISDECVYVYKKTGTAAARDGFDYCLSFTQSTLDWLYRQVKTREVLQKINSFTNVFLALEEDSKTSFMSRLKHEQSEIRRAVMRIHEIREVRFSEAAYAIAEIISYAVIGAMVFLSTEPFYEGLFFTLFVAFIFIYMLFLIKDLDDPFAYYDQKHSVEEISLHSLEDLKERLEERRKKIV